MSDLPSREFVRSMIYHNSESLLNKLLRAYADGRIIDRKNIDYEAAADQLGEIDWMALQRQHPSSAEEPPREWLLEEAVAAVDAALNVEEDNE